MNVIKWLILALLVVTNTAQFFIYKRIKRKWDQMPIVAATVTKSTLRDFHDTNGRRRYEPDIRFEFSFQGKNYESRTPALRSPQLLPQWNYVNELVNKYNSGEMYNARVVPEAPNCAYLEVEPLNKIAAFLLPTVTLLYGLYLLGFGWLIISWW